MPYQTETGVSTAGQEAHRARAIRHVLVPLDGSTLAEQALPVGAALAARAGGTLHLVRAAEPVTQVAPEVAREAAREAGAEVRRYLETIGRTTAAGHPGAVVTAELRGRPSDAVRRYADRQEVDLIVMTTRGRGGLARWWLGSVADELLRRSGTPLLLLHAGQEAQPTSFESMLVGLDGECDHRVLERALVFGALAPGSRFILAQVVEPEIPLLTPLARYPHHVGPNWDERRVDEAAERLSSLAEKLRRGGVEATWKVVEGRGVADSVLELAHSLGADCLVVGTHGLEGIDRMVLGSVAAKILRGAEVPVLVVPVGQAPTGSTTEQ